MPSLARDAPGRGRKPFIARKTLQAIAADCASGFGSRRATTVRAAALKYGVSRSTVQRIWSALESGSETAAPRGKGN
jgi:DNA invertase Pin-like site-specific DNA recombinase